MQFRRSGVSPPGIGDATFFRAGGPRPYLFDGNLISEAGGWGELEEGREWVNLSHYFSPKISLLSILDRVGDVETQRTFASLGIMGVPADEAGFRVDEDTGSGKTLLNADFQVVTQAMDFL